MLKLLFHLALIPANCQLHLRSFLLHINLDDALTETLLMVMHLLPVLLMWFNIFSATDMNWSDFGLMR